MPEYSSKWKCEAYKTDSKIRMAVWRLDDENNTIKIPLDNQVKSAKIIYPLANNGEVTATENGVTVTLDRQNTAALIEVEI